MSRVRENWDKSSKRKKAILILLPLLVIALFIFLSRGKKIEAPVDRAEVTKTVTLASV